MAEQANSTDDEVSRLEAALARIAHARLKPSGKNEAGLPAGAEMELAARLDGLIAEIRGVLDKDFME